MKTKLIVITLVVLITVTLVYAADVKWSALDELTAVADDDVLCVIDTGAGASKKITVLNFFDTIDTFAELNTIVANKTLVNEEDAAGWDALGTFNLGITITTGDPFTLGVVRWDNGSDKMDGEQIADNTIDVDSLDWGAFTDLGESGAVSWGNIAEGELADSSVISADIKNGEVALVDLAAAAYAKDLVTTAPITGAADNVFVGADSDVTVALDFTAAWDFSGATVTMPSRTANDDRYFAFNCWNPNALYDTDTQLCIEPNLPANITITEVTVTLDADPTTELDWDLKWADAFIGLGNAALVVAIDTTAGTTYIASGFDDATVAAGKCLYVEFGADPDSNITQAMVKIKYDYD